MTREVENNGEKANRIKIMSKYLVLLIVGIFPVGQVAVLEDAPSAMPRSESTHVFKHCLTTRTDM